VETQKRQRIIRALVQQVDSMLQRHYRQSLKEVVQDLTVRNILRSPQPSDDQILKTIYETGVFRMRGSPKTAEMHSLLERFSQGTIGFCLRCGKPINVHRLEKNIAASLCSRCHNQADGRKVPS
jgi:RNA polymerase-binding transcription factor DksA